MSNNSDALEAHIRGGKATEDKMSELLVKLSELVHCKIADTVDFPMGFAVIVYGDGHIRHITNSSEERVKMVLETLVEEL